MLIISSSGFFSSSISAGMMTRSVFSTILMSPVSGNASMIASSTVSSLLFSVISAVSVSSVCSVAGSVVVAVPITLLFLKMQKYYVEGVTAGGVKG